MMNEQAGDPDEAMIRMLEYLDEEQFRQFFQRGAEMNGAADQINQQMYRNITAARRRIDMAENNFNDAEFARIRSSRSQYQVDSLYNLARRRVTHPTFYQIRSRPFRRLPQVLQDDITRTLLAVPARNHLRMYRAMLGMSKLVIDLNAKHLARDQIESLILLLKEFGKETPRELYLTTHQCDRNIVTLDHVIQLLKHLKALEVVELNGVNATDVIIHALPSTLRKLVINAYARDLRPRGVPSTSEFSHIIHPILPHLSARALLTLFERCPQLTWIEAPQTRLREENALFLLLDARPHLTCLQFYAHFSYSMLTQFISKHNNTPLKLEKYVAEDSNVDKLNISNIMPDLKYLKFYRTSNMDTYLELKNVEELTMHAETRCSDYNSHDLLENLGRNLVQLECSGHHGHIGLSLFYIAKYCPRLVNLKYYGYDIASQGEGPFSHDPDIDLILFNMYNEGIVPQYFRNLQSVTLIENKASKCKKGKIKLPLFVCILTAPNLKYLKLEGLDIQSALDSSLLLAESDDQVFSCLHSIEMSDCAYKLWDIARWIAYSPRLKICTLSNRGEYSYQNLHQFITKNLPNAKCSFSTTQLKVAFPNPPTCI